MKRIRSWAPIPRLSACFALLFLALTLFAACASADIKFKTQVFESAPSYIFYFEDSDTILVHLPDDGVLWRSTDGGMEWKKLGKDEGLEPGDVERLDMSQTSNKHAIAFGMRDVHWITKDQGKSWQKFELPGIPDPNMMNPLSWHADDPDKIIVKVMDLKERAFRVVYTTSGFRDRPTTLIEDAWQCIWAKEKKQFNSGSSDIDRSKIICIIAGKNSNSLSDTILVSTDDYFKNGKFTELELDSNRDVTGLTNIVGVQSYLLAAQRAPKTTEMAMYISRDGVHWRRALFGNQRIESQAYTVMESSQYAIQVDVMLGHYDNPVGNLYTSDFNGTRFTKTASYTNRNMYGIGDFENLQNIQGVSIVNIVDNYEDILGQRGHQTKKLLKSQISFNGGRDFQDLKTKDGHILHVHSMVDDRNGGRVFSSPAPGLVMAVGNTGKYQEKPTDGDLYVSKDAGETWKHALDGAHIYEFGDSGAVLVAVYDSSRYDDDKTVSQIMYSLDFGEKWDKFEMGDEKFIPRMLTTTPDSTSLKFTLLATRKDSKGKAEFVVYGFDFEGLDLKKCGKDDFEKWYARVDADGNAGCVMGHKQSFRRRKSDAKCFVEADFDEEKPDNAEKCACSETDFECEFGLARDGKDCVPTEFFQPPKDVCTDDEKEFKGPPKFRKIPGDLCDEEKGKDLAKEPGTYPCDVVDKPKEPDPNDDTTFGNATATEFSSRIKGIVYLERASTSERHDETVLVLTEEGKVWRTEDQGKGTDWKAIVDDGVENIIRNPYWNDVIYFLTRSSKVFYSMNRGESVDSFDAPYPPAPVAAPMRFHRKNPKWFLWVGCKSASRDGECTNILYATERNGLEGSWQSATEEVEHCEYVWREEREVEPEHVVCDRLAKDSSPDHRRTELVSSADYFKNEKIEFADMLSWATMAEFIIVAAKAEGDFLRIDASVDAKEFAEAKFPPKYEQEHRTSFTVLESSTHAVFLFVTEHDDSDYGGFGSIIKSNSNGTSYVMSLRSVNRNKKGYVDFEKIGGVEGVAIANIVENAEAVPDGAHKKLKTVITHNDGSKWDSIEAPKEDSDGKKYDCDTSDRAKCSLHLQSYTEKPHQDDSFSSPSAVGFLIGVGNVGEHLDEDSKGDTFFSDDGGLTWKEIKKGPAMWEFGDQGSIILLVEEREVDTVMYSTDNGQTWKTWQFSPKRKIRVEDLTTVPSDTSRHFMMWGRFEDAGDGLNLAVNLDFTNLTDLQCKWDKDPDKSDYGTFTPRHPNERDPLCLFGRKISYRRKKAERECFNGPDLLAEKYDTLTKNCGCQESDFECAYNYERTNDGNCHLVEGLQPQDPTAVCEKPDVWQYFDPSPYRKLPISTCESGKQLDKSASHICLNKDPGPLVRGRGISGLGLFFAIVIPVGLAAAIGWYLYRHYGDGKLGQIRLGEAGTARMQWNQGSLVQLPVMLVSAAAAAVMALPFVVGSVYRSLRKRFGREGSYRGVIAGSRFTSRRSFARGRGGYTSVNADESDLLGEDSDDDA